MKRTRRERLRTRTVYCHWIDSEGIADAIAFWKQSPVRM